MTTPESLPDRMTVGRVVLTGLRIGLLFVRPATEREIAASAYGNIDLRGLWLIDVPTTTILVTGVRDFWHAVLIADEVNRFAVLGVEQLLVCPATEPSVARVLGKSLVRWLEYVIEAEAGGWHVFGFREWCERQGLKAPRAAPIDGIDLLEVPHDVRL